MGARLSSKIETIDMLSICAYCKCKILHKKVNYRFPGMFPYHKECKEKINIYISKLTKDNE
jgi:hypothetical protein